MYLKFHVKSLLYRYIPGGYGYYRYLSKFKDTNYKFARDKHLVREKHNGKSGWKEQRNNNILYRDYSDYNEYLVHQIQKWDEILKINGGFDNLTIYQYRKKFFLRFNKIGQYVKKNAVIVCAGARQGTEVEVLRDLKFNNSYGIDLNPGPNNPYVKTGDFLKMDEKDSSIDLIYTNAVDHSFNIEMLFAEHKRVIKPDGFIMYDLAENTNVHSRGAFEAALWENDEQIIQIMLKYFKQLVWVDSNDNWKWLLFKGKNN